jgi:hypothetical protein
MLRPGDSSVAAEWPESYQKAAPILGQNPQENRPESTLTWPTRARPIAAEPPPIRHRLDAIVPEFDYASPMDRPWMM